MKVLNVYWDSIPKEQHNHILDVLDKGAYIASLPFAGAEHQKIFKVAVPGDIKVIAKYDPSDLSVCETKILTFSRVFARKNSEEPTFVWRKE